MGFSPPWAGLTSCLPRRTIPASARESKADALARLAKDAQRQSPESEGGTSQTQTTLLLLCTTVNSGWPHGARTGFGVSPAGRSGRRPLGVRVFVTLLTQRFRLRPRSSLGCQVPLIQATRNLGEEQGMASAQEMQAHEANGLADVVDNVLVDEAASLGVRRFFTIPGRDPFEEIEWEVREACISGRERPVFEQRGVEFPRFWSQTATNIVAQKYFRGRMSSPGRERSVKQMVSRVADTIVAWGGEGGYFASEEEAETFGAEVKALLVNQYAAFNSPVWFNVGFEERPQCSACFILSIEDSMESILDWIRREGMIFRGGSGSGVNLSKLRSSKEQLSKGGYASGPVSFMRGADASAGTIKSGGKTRRAAKMVVLDVDHPDVGEFVWCKAKEERKARVLEAAGYAMSP